MGLPKSFKTGAVVGSYPKPMLYLGFDRGGIDIIPSSEAAYASNPTLIRSDVLHGEIKNIPPGQLQNWVTKPESEQPKVLSIQCYDGGTPGVSLEYKPSASQLPMQLFVQDFNHLCGKPTLPWKTIVMDSASGFSDLILSHISAVNSNAMLDPRQWASMCGGKIKQTVLSLTMLPAHVVIILHSTLDKNELTGEIKEEPSLYSKGLREDFFGLFSQVFYATMEANNIPMVLPSQRYPVKGIGCRWPIGLPSSLAPDFKSIYGKELLT